MFVFSRSRHVQLILSSLLWVVSTGNLLIANDAPGQALDSISAVQSAELRLVEAQLEFERWKHRQIEELHANGFASWLEMRRHQFKVDSIATRLKSAQEFSQFLSAIEQRLKKTELNSRLAFQQRFSKPVKIYAQNSIRLVGWLESRSTSTAELQSFCPSELTEARANLAQAQTRYQRAIDADPQRERWLEKTRLELAIADRELELARANQGLANQGLAREGFVREGFVRHSMSDLNLTINDVGSYIAADQNKTLNDATMAVRRLEASARGSLKAAQTMLQREQRRSDAVRRLHGQGHATRNELRIVNQRLAKAQSRLDECTAIRETQMTALGWQEGSVALPTASESPSQSPSITQWPDVVCHDKEFVIHLVDLRRELYREMAVAATNRMKAEFLQQVHDRLTAAFNPSPSNRPVGSVLIEGQRNELESYELDIQFAKASLQASQEKQQILVQEENRFIAQAVAIIAAAEHEFAGLAHPAPSTLGWVSQIRPTNLVFAAHDVKLTRFSYLETGTLDDRVQSETPSLRQPWLTYVESPYSFRSLTLYNLQPAQSSLVVSEARRSRSDMRQISVEPVWMRYFQRELGRNSEQTLRLSGPPYNDAWPQRTYYGQYGYRAFGGASAYPNGILRADWRSSLTPGQVPWYAPGSPANIRANQLYYRRESRPSQRW